MALADLLELSNTLAWTLLHCLWQGLLVGAVYGLCKRLSASVAWQHALALGGLLAMLALPMATFWWLLQQPAALAVAVEAASGPPALTGAVTASAAVDAAGGGPGALWAFALVSAWLLGAVVISTRLFGDWRLIRSAIREGARPPAALQALLEEQMQRIGLTRPVRLRLTARITTPGVYGLLRPVVLLPTALALSLPRDQIEALLMHELAHIRRADFLANVLALFARTLLYFHPVVHWLCRDLERTRETLCDDLVVGLRVDRLKYARALSTAEAFRQQVPAPLLTATGGELSARVHRILALVPDRRREQDRAPLLLALAAIVLSLLGLQGVAPDAPFAVARPDFRVAYQTLTAPAQPRLAIAAPSEAARVRPDLIRPNAIISEPAEPVAPLTGLAAMDSASAPDTVSAAPAQRPAPTPLLALATAAPSPLLSTELVPTTPRLDTTLRQALQQPAAQSTSEVPPRAIRRSEPYYPRNARWQGVEGHVTLSYQLDDSGTPVAVRVIEAEPAGQFERAALAAFDRWRFEPAGAGDRRWSQTFEFSLRDDEGRCQPTIGSRICRRAVSTTDALGTPPEHGAEVFQRDRIQHGFTRQGATLRVD